MLRVGMAALAASTVLGATAFAQTPQATFIDDLVSRYAQMAAPSFAHVLGDKGEDDVEIERHCAFEWDGPDEQDMRWHCLAKQHEGRVVIRDSVREIESYGGASPAAWVLRFCLDEWRQGNTFDYPMVLNCTESQFEAIIYLNTVAETNIIEDCVDHWRIPASPIVDYRMVKHCYGERALNR